MLPDERHEIMARNIGHGTSQMSIFYQKNVFHWTKTLLPKIGTHYALPRDSGYFSPRKTPGLWKFQFHVHAMFFRDRMPFIVSLNSTVLICLRP